MVCEPKNVEVSLKLLDEPTYVQFKLCNNDSSIIIS